MEAMPGGAARILAFAGLRGSEYKKPELPLNRQKNSSADPNCFHRLAGQLPDGCGAADLPGDSAMAAFQHKHLIGIAEFFRQLSFAETVFSVQRARRSAFFIIFPEG